MVKNDLFDLAGKLAVVTGAGQGIGRGIARGLAMAGADIVIGELNPKTMQATAAEIRSDFGVRVLEIELDVLNEKQIDRLFERTLKDFNAIDILVNNAGIAISRLPHEISLQEWDLNIDINLRSVFVMSRKVYPHMKTAGGGKIINIGSMFAIFGGAWVPAYAVSKGGVVQLTKSLANAWAANNIQVNAIMPGWINTELSAQGRIDNPRLHDDVLARTPAGRWGEPEELAGAAVFLASKASQFVTGVALPVDGGYSVF